ncbi:MAG TPA: glycosyltransferase [Campylobacterales bacterium]|nr:glycosyltransferase [Campylobacterales bacterium]
MDIVLYLKNLQGRGVQKVYLNLAKGLQELGHHVHFVIRQNRIELDYRFLEHFYLFEENVTAHLDILLAQLDDPVLIANDVKTTLELKNIAPERIYHTVHMLWGERIFKQLRLLKWFELKRLYRDKQLIGVSEAVKEDLLHKVKIEPKSIEVIADGFDIEAIQALAQEPIDVQGDYILNIGALSREKNQKLLLESYAKLDTPLALVILGEGKLKASLEKLAHQLGIAERVHFLGFKPNPYPYIKHAKLVVSTSTNEALPGVAIESLILHTPVVSTDSLGIRSVLTGKFDAFIVKQASALPAAIEKALKAYPTIGSDDYEQFGYREVALAYLNVVRRVS